MMSLYLTITFIVIAAYIVLNLFLLHNWFKDDQNDAAACNNAEIKYSIIIPVRNEEKHIAQCLKSILSNDGFNISNIEIIVIDDHSQDLTKKCVEDLAHPSITLVSLSDYIDNQINAYKKAAILIGHQKATGDYIIQLDGDVLVPKNYLKTVDTFIRKTNADFISAPVLFKSNGSAFENFQTLDFLGMMLVTQAGIFSKKWLMANGANMIFRKKKIDYDLTGVASGDDVYTIQTIAEDSPNGVYFLKSLDAAVTTFPQADLRSFYNQRLRWGTKNKSMEISMLFMMSVPFINALLLVVHVPLILFFGKVALIMLLVHYTLKGIVDYILLQTATVFYKKERALNSFLISTLWHILYISIVGLSSLFIKRYSWKGRKVF